MKKIIIIIVLFASVNTYGQRVALLSTDFHQPIIYTDSVTVEQISKGFFPVSTENFDTLYANLDYIHSMLSKLQRSKMKSFELHAGSTVINITRVPFSNGDRYNSYVYTTIGEVKSKMNLTPIDRSNKKNAEHIEKIMDYMKTNKSLFKAPYSVQPKIYNVVVISE